MGKKGGARDGRRTGARGFSSKLPRGGGGGGGGRKPIEKRSAAHASELGRVKKLGGRGMISAPGQWAA